MITRYRPSIFRRGSRRGSIYVVVIAGLAILGLMTLTLSYTAQMEEQASRNWSEGIQARIGAITGVPVFNGAMSASPSASPGAMSSMSADPRAPRLFSTSSSSDSSRRGTRRNDSVLTVASTASRIGFGASGSSQPAGKDAAEALRLLLPRVGATVDNSAFLKSDVAYHRIEDESAKFNLNALLDVNADLSDAEIDFLNTTADADLPDPIAAPSVRQAGAFIDALLKARHIESKRSGEELLQGMVAYRYGSDGKPGHADTDDNFNGADADLAARLASASIKDLRMAIRSPLAVPINADGRDNDRDGQVDESDESVETDGADNDHDGSIDEGFEGIDEPAEFRADIRLKPIGDDRPLSRIDNLLQVPGFTPEIVDALRPYFTIFSVSRTGSSIEGNDESGIGLVSIDPNTGSPEEIFSLLRARYPDHPEELIGQYVVNLIDRRDQDNVPSELTLGSLGEAYTGIEVTPYINEVCPDVATFTEDGDDGQFVELFNPYTQSFDLTGWRLETGTSTVFLRGVLSGGGILVITDDYDDSNDSEPEEEAGFGSLYDVFGVVAVTLDSLVQEQESFDLNDQQGIVKLYDNQDSLVDTFAYTNGQFTGANLSFQRVDPRVRYTVKDFATPLDKNKGYKSPSHEEEAGLALFEALHNGPFRSPLEMMLVSTSFAPAGEAVASPVWRFPSTHTGVGDNLDIAVIDLFQPGSPPPLRIPSSEASEWAGANLPEGTGDILSQLLSVIERPPAFHGRINLNTASAGVLAVLPGIGKDLAARIVELRDTAVVLGDDFPTIEAPSVSESDSDESDEPAEDEEAETGEAEAENGIYGEIPVLDQYGFAALGFGAQRKLSPSTDLPDSGETQADEWFIARSPQAQPRWKTLSEFIRDRELWGDTSLVERMERTYPFSGMVSFDSLAYRVKTANIPNSQSEADENRRASVMYTERILAADRQSIETVVFLYGHRVADGRR